MKVMPAPEPEAAHGNTTGRSAKIFDDGSGRDDEMPWPPQVSGWWWTRVGWSWSLMRCKPCCQGRQ